MELKHIKACIDARDFANRGYSIEGVGIYSKLDVAFFVNPYTRTQEAVSRFIRFKVFDVDPELGTNVEYYIDKKLILSGYWTTKRDFLTSFHYEL